MPSLDALNEARLAAAAEKTAADKKAAADAATAATVAAGGKSTDPANRLPGETASQANARITAGYQAQPKPELTQEGAAAGATIEFVRTGAGGVGTYKEVFPIGTPIPTNRTTTSGNVYDAQGNLVSGTGLKSGSSTLNPGDPGYVAPKTILKPGDPGYVAPDAAEIPKTGTLLRYIPGKTTGTRIPVYADGKGGEFNGEESNNPINPGSTGLTDTGVVTLASNTFANTLSLLMGELEASQPWVEELRSITQGFINSGSPITEAINLALREAKAQGKASKFVNRFSAIFKLQDRLNAGETVQVPSIADYIKSEQSLGDVFRAVGLGDLATQDIASKILGDANKSVAEATSIINDVFNTIDNAPAALKADLQQIAPGLDRTSLAKALLLGKEGAAELTKKVAGMSQVSAAKSQGVMIDSATGLNLAAGGETYSSSLGRFATVKELERGQSLGKMSGIDFTQNDAIASTFNSSSAADEKIRRIKEEEANRFAAKGARLASQDRATNQY